MTATETTTATATATPVRRGRKPGTAKPIKWTEAAIREVVASSGVKTKMALNDVNTSAYQAARKSGLLNELFPENQPKGRKKKATTESMPTLSSVA